jgi:hypothetical protein
MGEKINLLCKLVSEIFNIKDMTSGFALVFPLLSIGIEDTVTKEIIHGTMEFRSLDVDIKIGYCYKKKTVKKGLH